MAARPPGGARKEPPPDPRFYEAEEAEVQAIVLDNGSSSMKAGFAGNDMPSVFDDTITFDWGVTVDWDAMEKNWFATFYNGHWTIAPEDHPVLLTEPPLQPAATRERLIQLMFETFCIPALRVEIPAVLSLLASGRQRGCVVDSGHCLTSVVPIVDGHALPHAIVTLDVAGRDLTDYMLNILTERNSFLSTNDREIVHGIKKRLAYVALDFDEEMKTAEATGEITQVPGKDGAENIVMVNEHFRCPEALFQPDLIGKGSPGIHRCIVQAINNCHSDVTSDLYGSIILAGGTTMCTGITERIDREVATLAPPDMDIQIIAPDTRQYSAFLGGSILAGPILEEGGLDRSIWFCKEQYYEEGPECGHSVYGRYGRKKWP